MMKTYAFHSHKGGSGRTLALANFALFLRQKKKTVLMIDFDFDAPGLPYKFDAHNRLNGGYIDYLFGISAAERAQPQDRKLRVDLLKDCLVTVQDGLTLLPAGDPHRMLYWKQISSPEFHRLFSFTNSPRAGSRSAKTNENWRAFKQDIEVIAEAAGNPDYCLIDCKAAQESVAVPLLTWASHIVEFLHCNREGVSGTLILLRALTDNQLRDKFEFTPVVARTSYGGRSAQTDSDAGYMTSVRHQIRTEIASIVSGMGSSFFADIRFPDEFEILVEQKEVEIGDVLLLNEQDSSAYTLSYNYVELFSALAGLVSEREKQESLIALKLNQEDELVERIFRFSFRRGELLNQDGERNIALRKRTIIELMNSLAIDQDTALAKEGITSKEQRLGDIQRAFENAGRKAGQSFGLEAISVPEVWENCEMPETPLERLRQWCIFDRNAGFGNWTAEYAPEDKEGVIRINNNFLEKTQDDVGWYFVRGYVHGVLSYLVGETGNIARITINPRSDSKRILFSYEGDQGAV